MFTFQELNLKWNSNAKANNIQTSTNAVKKLPDSGSTVDPAEHHDQKAKLENLEIKSIRSESDEDEEEEKGKTDRPRVKLEESVIVVDFFKLDQN